MFVDGKDSENVNPELEDVIRGSEDGDRKVERINEGGRVRKEGKKEFKSENHSFRGV